MNTTCYVCKQPVLEDDIPIYKTINEVKRIRHYWHIVPNHDYIQGMSRYAPTLETAKRKAIDVLAAPYKTPEQKEAFKVMLDECNRLLRLQTPHYY